MDKTCNCGNCIKRETCKISNAATDVVKFVPYIDVQTKEALIINLSRGMAGQCGMFDNGHKGLPMKTIKELRKIVSDNKYFKTMTNGMKYSDKDITSLAIRLLNKDQWEKFINFIYYSYKIDKNVNEPLVEHDKEYALVNSTEKCKLEAIIFVLS